jgi:3-methyladenine DNA glycosylase AlkD
MNNKSEIIDDVRRDLALHDKPEFKINAQQFVKEKLANPYVIKSSVMREISATHFRKLKGYSKDEIFNLCDFFLESSRPGEKSIAFDWTARCRNDFGKNDFARFERWLKKYVNGWGSCDNICCNIIGILLHKYPELIARTVKWRKSKSRWLKRASAVSLIYSLQKGTQLKIAFEIADTLLLDDDDMVQKGYGWMLKVAANSYPEDVFKYVMKHRNIMPRTALRYAIEKYPKKKREEAMSKT